MLRLVLRALSLSALFALTSMLGACSSDSDSSGTEVSDQKVCAKGGQCVCSQDCTKSCDEGGCQFVCDGAAKCTFSCKGGNCMVSGGGSTSLDCSGGGCSLACTNPTGCSCTDPTKCVTN